MAKVPIYQSQTQAPGPTFVPQQEMPWRISSEAGRGAAEFGQGLNNLSNDLSRIALDQQQEDNVREATQLKIQYSAALRMIGYGDGTDANLGYYSTAGDGAIAQYGPTREAMAKARQDIIGTIKNPAVLKLFSDASAAMLEEEYGQVDRFAQKQREVANLATSKAHINDALDNAIAAWNNPKVRNTSLAVIDTETNYQLDKAGITDPGARHEAITAARSELWQQVIGAASLEDPVAARKLYNENIGNIDGRVQPEIERVLKQADAWKQAQLDHARAEADRALTKAREARFNDFMTQILMHDKDPARPDADPMSIAADKTLTGEQKYTLTQVQSRLDRGEPATVVSKRNVAALYDQIIGGTITDTRPLLDAFTSTDANKQIGRTDFDWIMNQFANLRSEQGEPLRQKLKDVIDIAKPTIMASILPGSQGDPVQAYNWGLYQDYVSRKIEQYRKENKDVFDLFRPMVGGKSNPDYLLAPDLLAGFQQTMQQSLDNMVRRLTQSPEAPAGIPVTPPITTPPPSPVAPNEPQPLSAPATPNKYQTLQELQDAYNKGEITRQDAMDYAKKYFPGQFK